MRAHRSLAKSSCLRSPQATILDATICIMGAEHLVSSSSHLASDDVMSFTSAARSRMSNCPGPGLP